MLEEFATEQEQIIDYRDSRLVYMGRMHEEEQGLLWVFPCSLVKISFHGKSLRAVITNHRNYWNNYMGVIVDGVQSKVELSADEEPHVYTLFKGEAGEHEVLLFKRQDACHHIFFHGILLDKEGLLYVAKPMPDRRMEVYGDSVSAGEVSEAVEYVGKADPEHNGEFSNSFYSYSWLTARKLHCALHDIAQGGIALFDRTGWFSGPDYVGMESVYDKIAYNPYLKEKSTWEFARYTPQLVVLAFGQNDSNPEDYMKEDYEGEKAKRWRKGYRNFLLTLKEKYPKATFILTTTILRHDPSWDRAIDEVAKEFEGQKVYHFLYSNNGDGTDGHIRIPEAEQMSDELAAFIEGLGEEVWRE